MLKLVPGAKGKALADEIQEPEFDNIGPVYSVAETLQEWQATRY